MLEILSVFSTAQCSCIYMGAQHAESATRVHTGPKARWGLLGLYTTHKAYITVTSCQKSVMITPSQLTVVVWAPCPWSHPTGKECNVVTKRIPIVLGHFVNRTVLHLTWGIEMINHIYSCQIIAANDIVLCVLISVLPCFPSYRA